MQKITNRLFWSVLFTVIGGLIFVLGLNLLNFIPEKYQDIYKIGLPILLLVAFFTSRVYFPQHKTVFFAFFLVSLGWTVDFYLTGKIISVFSLNTRELSGFAYTMIISTLLVSATLITGWLLSGQKLSAIYMQGSEKIWGILLGIVGLLLFGGLGVLQSLSQGLAMEFIMTALPMTLIFSLANGFREELVYRAAFLRGFQTNIGLTAAIIVTTLVFTLAHLDVRYTPSNLIVFAAVLVIIGITGSLIMIKTGSLIGSVLFHAGADVLLVMGLLASHQLIVS